MEYAKLSCYIWVTIYRINYKEEYILEIETFYIVTCGLWNLIIVIPNADNEIWTRSESRCSV